MNPQNDACRNEAAADGDGTMSRLEHRCHTTQMWTSKVWFNRPYFEKNSCPTRPTVTRDHKLHGRHEKSPTNLQVEQYNRIRGGELFKERGNATSTCECWLVPWFEKPTSRHLVQPIAWRRPDLGLSSTNDVCRTRTWYHAPRQRDEVSMPRLKHRNHKTTWTSKAWFNQLSFEKFVRVPPAQP